MTRIATKLGVGIAGCAVAAAASLLPVAPAEAAPVTVPAAPVVLGPANVPLQVGLVLVVVIYFGLHQFRPVLGSHFPPRALRPRFPHIAHWLVIVGIEHTTYLLR